MLRHNFEIQIPHLLITFITMVGVGALQQFTLYVLLQRLVQRTMVANVHAEHAERLLFRVPMRTTLTNFLIAKAAAQGGAHKLRMAERLESFVETLEERHEELDGVLLFAQVHRFALKSI